MTTYYSTQRPIDIGTYPKPIDNKVLEIKNFDEKKEIKEENIMAFGYIRYEKPLIPAAAKTYELKQASIEPNAGTTQAVNENAENNIIEKAILKIQDEEDGWCGLLKNFLIEQLKADTPDMQLAQGILDENKNFQTCNKHLYKWVFETMNVMEKERTQVGNARGVGVPVEHKKVYSEAIHYFTEVEEKPEEVPVKPTTKPNTEYHPPITATAPMTKKEKMEAQFACSLF